VRLPNRTYLLATAFALADALVVSGCREAKTAKVGVPNCSFSAYIDTTGWQLAKLFSRPVTFRLPKSFHRDPHARSRHGGISWVDGDRTLDQANGIWGEPSRLPVYSRCVDTLAGKRYWIVTFFDGISYNVVAQQMEPDAGRSYSEALIARSPDSLDVNLFLTVLHTMRQDPAHHAEAH